MTELKTKANARSVERFVAGITDETRRRDVERLIAVMKAATKAEPRMWGDSIIGFGSFHYSYASGREGDWFVAGLSPRKGTLTLYVLPGLQDHQDLLPKLGTFTTGKSCIYVKRLDDIHLPTLRTMVGRAAKRLARGFDATAATTGSSRRTRGA